MGCIKEGINDTVRGAAGGGGGELRPRERGERADSGGKRGERGLVVETAREAKGPDLGEHTGQSRREKAME